MKSIVTMLKNLFRTDPFFTISRDGDLICVTLDTNDYFRWVGTEAQFLRLFAGTRFELQTAAEHDKACRAKWSLRWKTPADAEVRPVPASSIAALSRLHARFLKTGNPALDGLGLLYIRPL